MWAGCVVASAGSDAVLSAEGYASGGESWEWAGACVDGCDGYAVWNSESGVSDWTWMVMVVSAGSVKSYVSESDSGDEVASAGSES